MIEIAIPNGVADHIDIMQFVEWGNAEIYVECNDGVPSAIVTWWPQ